MDTELGREDRLRQRKDVGVHTSVPGGEYAYRPGQCVVHADDMAMVHDELTELGAKPENDKIPGLVVYRVPAAVNIPELVTRLRATDGGRTPRVGPNHVLFGAPAFRGSPGDEPVPAGPVPIPVSKTEQRGHGVRVVVLDTGLDAQAKTNPWLEPVIVNTPDIDLTVDALPADGFIDEQAGHGAFVAGLVRQAALGAEVTVVRVLDTEGITDEVTIANAITRVGAAGDADIINLSLGGYCHGDLPPLAIAAAIAGLPRTMAVVAAAGNFGSSRPFWPAALKRVIAVGAIDEDAGPASFSNRGSWVDACAPGVRCHSVYVSGDERPGVSPSQAKFTGWAYWSGTSFACAAVAAAVAVEQQQGGGTARQAADRLLGDPSRPELQELGAIFA